MAVTVRQERLGLKLAQLRKSSNWTQDNVEAQLGASRNTLWRMETGRSNPNTRGFKRNFAALLDIYEASESERARLTALLELACKPTWWEDARYADLYPDALRLYYSCEADAFRADRWNGTGFYGLFQTIDYARAVNRARVVSDQVMDREVELRLVRQREAFAPTRRLKIRAVMCESVLWRVYGSKAIMAAQLAHLLKLLDSGHDLTIQVLPFTSGVPIQGDADFTIFDMGDGDRRGSIDTSIGAINWQDSDSIAGLVARFSTLSQGALPQDESTDLIRKIAKEHEKDRE